MHITNPHWTMARRRAARFTAPHLAKPTVERKALTPKVKIGILRDPVQPIRIQPSIHAPAAHIQFDRFDATALFVLVGLASLLFI